MFAYIGKRLVMNIKACKFWSLFSKTCYFVIKVLPEFKHDFIKDKY